MGMEPVYLGLSHIAYEVCAIVDPIWPWDARSDGPVTLFCIPQTCRRDRTPDAERQCLIAHDKGYQDFWAVDSIVTPVLGCYPLQG